VPVILLEQNRAAGRANRLLAPFVDAVASSFAGLSFPGARRVEVTGNPVRRAVLAAAACRRDGAGARGVVKRRILVMGGSQGATAINRAVREALPALAEFRDGIEWSHIAGDADKEGMMAAYRTHGWDAEVVSYSDDLPGRMAACDAVLGRAGGTTLAELAVIGTPAVLVPYPHHRDRHQWLNAESFAREGAARLLPEAELGAASLGRLCGEVVSGSEDLALLGRRAQALARPDAADRVIDLALGIACRSLSGSFS
jgi:UDP-N-acetylglucosamine--N-acetylmuramyl-(pentapeptide) pyrophosphoryl-undecaprenol N-acetylglucosamine transferase